MFVFIYMDRLWTSLNSWTKNHLDRFKKTGPDHGPYGTVTSGFRVLKVSQFLISTKDFLDRKGFKAESHNYDLQEIKKPIRVNSAHRIESRMGLSKLQ